MDTTVILALVSAHPMIGLVAAFLGMVVPPLVAFLLRPRDKSAGRHAAPTRE